MPTCYSNNFKKEFQSNLTYFQTNLFRANFKKLFEYNKMCYFFIIKATIIYQSHSNDGIVFNCIFRYLLDYIKYFMSSILNTAQYFRSILNKEVYGILFILTQNAYLYTPIFSYALYVPVFFRITPAYKSFYFPYSAMFYFVIFFTVKQPNLFYMKC